MVPPRTGGRFAFVKGCPRESKRNRAEKEVEVLSNHLNNLPNLALSPLEVRSTGLIFPTFHTGDLGHGKISRGGQSVISGGRNQVQHCLQLGSPPVHCLSYADDCCAMISFKAFHKECHRGLPHV